MDINATLKRIKNQLTCKQANTYSHVLITKCSNSVRTTGITLYFEKVTRNMTGPL